jgi:hypothetical protein
MVFYHSPSFEHVLEFDLHAGDIVIRWLDICEREVLWAIFMAHGTLKTPHNLRFCNEAIRQKQRKSPRKSPRRSRLKRARTRLRV